MTRSRIFTIFSAVAIFLLLVMFPAYLKAEEITDNDFGYSLDIPEGFIVAGYTPDGMSYQFKNTVVPVELVLRLYTTDVYDSSKSALEGTLKRISATNYEIEEFLWQNASCAISMFESSAIMQNGALGWAISANLNQKNANLVLLCYADSKNATAYECVIASTLNSLCINNNKLSPGILTFCAFPKSTEKKVVLNIAGKKIETTIDSSDSEASSFVIDTEFSTLKFYANNNKWKEAWQRYYKMIFRDTYSRLSKVAFDINSALYPIALKKNPKNPEEELNALLLNWVQNFEYEHDSSNYNISDFTSPIDALCGAKSDCDSRSMLMCVLLRQNGIRTELFISREYLHAVYGADIKAQGAKIEENGINFLLGETTAKNIRPGLIAQDQSDTNKWIAVGLNAE